MSDVFWMEVTVEKGSGQTWNLFWFVEQAPLMEDLLRGRFPRVRFEDLGEWICHLLKWEVQKETSADRSNGEQTKGRCLVLVLFHFPLYPLESLYSFTWSILIIEVLFVTASVLDLNLINFILLELTINLHCINWISSSLAIELNYL